MALPLILCIVRQSANYRATGTTRSLTKTLHNRNYFCDGYVKVKKGCMMIILILSLPGKTKLTRTEQKLFTNLWDDLLRSSREPLEKSTKKITSLLEKFMFLFVRLTTVKVVIFKIR